MFAKRDKHYLSRSWQTSLATALTNFTKPVTKINIRPSIVLWIFDTFHLVEGGSMEEVVFWGDGNIVEADKSEEWN